MKLFDGFGYLEKKSASKASRTEQYPSLFFQSFWSVLGD